MPLKFLKMVTSNMKTILFFLVLLIPCSVVAQSDYLPLFDKYYSTQTLAHLFLNNHANQRLIEYQSVEQLLTQDPLGKIKVQISRKGRFRSQEVITKYYNSSGFITAEQSRKWRIFSPRRIYREHIEPLWRDHQSVNSTFEPEISVDEYGNVVKITIGNWEELFSYRNGEIVRIQRTLK
ncbi:MAG: hypothetical protein EA364_11130, partial [Balneolaceae bacterium]